MPAKKVSGARAQEIRDRLAAKRAGVDYDEVARSRDAEIARRETGSIFGSFGDTETSRQRRRSSRTQSVVQGALVDPIEGFTQLLTRGGNAAQRALGIDPNRSLENTIRGAVGMDETRDPVRSQGVFSDRSVQYNDARRRVAEALNTQGREEAGRSGFDAYRLGGSALIPTGRFAGAGRLAPAVQGAVAAALQPVDQEDGESFLEAKGKQIGLGAVGGQVIGGTAGALGRRAQRRAAARAAAGGSETGRIAAAAERLGTKVGLGQITGSRALRRLTDISANAWGGGSLVRRAQGTEDELADALEGVASGIGTGKAGYEAGSAAMRGVNRTGGFTERTATRASQLYGRVPQPEGLAVDMAGTVAAMRQTPKAFVTNPRLGRAIGNEKLSVWARLIAKNKNQKGEPGKLTYKEAERLRSEIGMMMGEKGPGGNDIPRRELANVYRALSDDMRSALEGTGDAKAVRAFDRATRYYSARGERIKRLDEIVGQSQSAEDVATRLSTMGRTDSQGLYSLRRSLDEDEWDKVASGLFRKMGEPSAGTADELGEGFSPSRFLTNFNKVQQNPRAFNALFGGTRYAGVREKLKDLALVSDRLRNNAKIANHSGTGAVNTMLGLLGISTLGAVPAAKIIGSNAAFANAMSNPKFLQAMIAAGNGLSRASRKGGQYLENAAAQALPRIMGTLAGYSEQEPEGEEY